MFLGMLHARESGISSGHLDLVHTFTFFSGLTFHNRRYLLSRAKASNNACNTGFLFSRVLSYSLGENPGDEGDQDVYQD